MWNENESCEIVFINCADIDCETVEFSKNSGKFFTKICDVTAVKTYYANYSKIREITT